MERVGPYEILDELGRGGMGVIYRARDPRSGREVALKLLLSGNPDPTLLKRFQREAEALARVRHAHVVAVHAAGQDAQGRPYLVLELVQGQSLLEQVDRLGRLDPRQAAELCHGLAQGLEAAHAQGIVHRDVKPANVLIDAEGRARLTDFGLARDLDQSLDATRLSKTGVFMGSPAYWPPEQARGDHQAVGPRSDVYALGATLFHLLAGEAPQDAPSLSEALAKLRDPPPPPSRLQPDAPADLDAVVLCCLAREPQSRYPSAAALADDLQRFLDGERVLARPPRRQVPWRWLALGLPAALALTLLLVTWTQGWDRAALAPTPSPHVSPRSPLPAQPPLERDLEAMLRESSPDTLARFQAQLLQEYDPGRELTRLEDLQARLRLARDERRVFARNLLGLATAQGEGLLQAARDYNRLPVGRLGGRPLSQHAVYDLISLENQETARVDPQSLLLHLFDRRLQECQTWSIGGTPRLPRAEELPRPKELGPAATILLRRYQQAAVRLYCAGQLSVCRRLIPPLYELGPAGAPRQRLRLIYTVLAPNSSPPGSPELSGLEPPLRLVQDLLVAERRAQPPPADLLQLLSSTNSLARELYEFALRRIPRVAYAEARATRRHLQDTSRYEQLAREAARQLARLPKRSPLSPDSFRSPLHLVLGALALLGGDVNAARTEARRLPLEPAVPRPRTALRELLLAEADLCARDYGALSDRRLAPSDAAVINDHLQRLSSAPGPHVDVGAEPRPEFPVCLPWHCSPQRERVLSGQAWWPGSADR